MPSKKRQNIPLSTKKIQLFGMTAVGVSLVACLLYGNIFIDRLLPVTFIILLIALIHNLGART